MLKRSGDSPARHRRPLSGAWLHRAVFLLLVLSGVAVTAFPVAETYYNNAQGVTVTEDYVQAVQAAPDAPLQQALVRAAAYNEELKPEALTDPWTARGATGNAEHDAYLAQLDGFGPMGRLRIPKILVDLPILHDANRSELGRGIGHMYGSSLPVGGAGTNAVLAGHTGSRNRVFLDRLTELRQGDLFYVDVSGETLTYLVDKIAIVNATDLASVARVPGADLVTLVTCTPDSRRLLVRGTRVPDGPTATATTVAGSRTMPTKVDFDDSVQPWMTPRLVIAGVGICLVLLMCLTWLLASIRSGHRSRAVGVRLRSTRPGPAAPEESVG